MFPLSVEGSVRLKTGMTPPEKIIKAVVGRIAAMLRERDITDVCIEEFRVRFHTSLWNDYERAGFLAGYGSGALDVEAGIDGVIVRYSFNAVRQAVILLACAALFLAAAYDGSLQSLGSNWDLAMIVVLAFFGFNHVSAWVRMPFWLRKGLRDLPELKSS